MDDKRSPSDDVNMTKPPKDVLVFTLKRKKNYKILTIFSGDLFYLYRLNTPSFKSIEWKIPDSKSIRI